MTTKRLLDLNLLSQAPYGAYAVDMNRIITLWNRSAERILGHRAGDVIGLRCCRVLQRLPDNGTTPDCVEGCPAFFHARTSEFPPVVQVTARCASGRRKPITITPLVIPHPHCDRTVLVNLFHERTEDARVETTAGRVQEPLATRTLLTQPSDQSSPEVNSLTERELEVLSLIGLGLSAREIAGELTISTNTARNHVRNVCGKLEARSKLKAVVIAQKRGLL